MPSKDEDMRNVKAIMSTDFGLSPFQKDVNESGRVVGDARNEMPE